MYTTLTSPRWRMCVHAKIVPIDNRRTFKHAFQFLCVWPRDWSTQHAWRAIVAQKLYPLIIGELLNTHSDFCVWPGDTKARVACHRGARLVHAIISRSPWVTVGWPWTKGTANNKRVHSFCWFLPNPFIRDLFLWHTSQEFVKTDLYPLSRGLWSLSGMPSVRPGAGR